MSLLGFGFSGYRSVGDEMVFIAPLKKINLIIGQNNSGKSNIINFLKYGLPLAVKKINNPRYTSKEDSGDYRFLDIDNHIGKQTIKPRVAFLIPIDRSYFDKYIFSSKANNNLGDKAYGLWCKLLLSDGFDKHNGSTWFIYEADGLNSLYKINFDRDKLKSVITENEWNSLWSSLTNKTGGDLTAHWIPETLDKISKIPAIPHIEIIPAIRKIGEKETQPDDYSGLGIIDRLAKLQHPALEQQHLKLKFDAINHFLRAVLENNTATLEIPYDNDMIQVHMDNKSLPLSSLGTGIHEVIILAAAATLLDNAILCVEEPELHLHPLLQRKLIKYLSDNTSNQYIFTTHSAHLLDTENAEIFHVINMNGKTTVDAIASTKAKSAICHDLGYKASDILQANCLIWVEGPSDRIYLNHWLKSVDAELVEGIHYAIMFFGGRLFSHITAFDKEDTELDLNDFISVSKLNRNSCIFFDSDKSSPKAKLNDTKKRLIEEFNSDVGFAWVTEGRETENYINPEHIEACVKEIHPSAVELIAKDKWANTLIYKQAKNKESTANKVKVARYYIENYPADLSIYDLNRQINKLKDFIYKANNLKN